MLKTIQPGTLVFFVDMDIASLALTSNLTELKALFPISPSISPHPNPIRNKTFQKGSADMDKYCMYK